MVLENHAADDSEYFMHVETLTIGMGFPDDNAMSVRQKDNNTVVWMMATSRAGWGDFKVNTLRVEGYVIALDDFATKNGILNGTNCELPVVELVTFASKTCDVYPMANFPECTLTAAEAFPTDFLVIRITFAVCAALSLYISVGGATTLITNSKDGGKPGWMKPQLNISYLMIVASACLGLRSIDPYGYQGWTPRLVDFILQDIGSCCLGTCLLQMCLFWRSIIMNPMGKASTSGRTKVSFVKCHFSTIMTVFMHQCEDRCHNIMH